jgi:alpha-L-fucosidase
VRKATAGSTLTARRSWNARHSLRCWGGSFSTTEKDEEGKPKFIPAWNWRPTISANKIYTELFAWPNGSFHLEKVPRQVTSAYLLADKSKKPLKITKTANGLDIALPGQALDPIATVLVLNTN